MSRSTNELQLAFRPIVSSNLDSAAYDRRCQELTVRFKNGTQFKYFDVSPTLWSDFQKLFDGKLGSPGSFFAKQIRFLSNEKLDDWQ
jgi:hypothetical protein